MAKVENYKTGQFNWPNRDVHSDEKQTPEYALAMAKMIYHYHLNDRTGLKYSNSTYYNTLRSYGLGRQPEDIYKKFFNTNQKDNQPIDSNGNDARDYNGNASSLRKSYNQLNWDIMSPAVKIMDMIKGLLYDYDFDVVANTIDPDSGAKLERQKYRLMAMADHLQTLNEMRAKAGLPIVIEEFLPGSREELELYEASGGFKLNYAKTIEKLLKHTENVSKWDELRDKLQEDLVNIGAAFARDRFCETRKKVIWEYVDPDNLIIQYSRYNDFRDSEYAGEIKYLTISDIRQMLPEMEESELMSIAKRYSGMIDNPREREWNHYKRVGNDGTRGYDDFRVMILDLEWIESDAEYKVEFTNKYGKKKVIDGKFGEILNDEKRKTKVYRTKNRYKCKWLVHTNTVFDYGLDFDQTRPQDTEVSLTVHGYKISGKSITERLKPIYDQFQINWLKYQNAISRAYYDGYAIDFSLLMNIHDGGKKFGFRELMDLWKDTGLLPYMSKNVDGRYVGGGVLPIQKIPGGIGEVLNETVVTFNLLFKMIEDITGFSPVSLGATPNPDVPVKSQERSLQATQNSLKNHILSTYRLKQYLAENTTARLQIGCRHNWEIFKKAYAGVVGEHELKVLKIAESSHVQYGIELVTKPTELDRQEIMRAAEIALQAYNQGNPGIDLATYTYLVEKLNNGSNLKQIRLELAYSIKKDEDRRLQEKQMLIQEQAQANMQMKQAEIQGRQAEKQIDVQAEMQLEEQKYQNKKKLLILEKNLEFSRNLTDARQGNIQ